MSDKGHILSVFRMAAKYRPNEDNMRSFIEAVVDYGDQLGVTKPHRLVQIGGQVMLESGEFRYDQEIWNGKGAQARYDTRTDLGNTPERDGDGYTYRGRGPIQLTGKRNYTLFTKWARKIDPNAPDFVKNPDLVNTDPWEGLVALFYWERTNLNHWADYGNTKKITRLINGGYNHLSQRIEYVTRLSLAVLGYDPDSEEEVKKFQRTARLKEDGDAGPKTARALHRTLKARGKL